MFDIRALRENPEAFRLAWNRRKPGLGIRMIVSGEEIIARH